MVDEYWWNGREKICAWCKQVLVQCMRIQLPNCDVNEGVGTRLAVAAPPPQLFWKKNKNSKWVIHLKLIIWYKRCDTFINIFTNVYAFVHRVWMRRAGFFCSWKTDLINFNYEDKDFFLMQSCYSTINYLTLEYLVGHNIL